MSGRRNVREAKYPGGEISRRQSVQDKLSRGRKVRMVKYSGSEVSERQIGQNREAKCPGGGMS